MQPFVSIIIPTFNVESQLAATIESVLTQSFEDFEILIIDGLSTDSTLKIAQQYVNSDSRVRLFSEKDAGIYDAMNKGILKSSGRYLYFLGSDDTLINPTVLKDVHEVLGRVEVDVMYGNVYSTRFNGIYDGLFTIEKLYFKNICHQAIFFKRCVFKRTGLFSMKYAALSDYAHNIFWFSRSNFSKRYEPITIANYADGGYSSTHKDRNFLEDKKRLFLKYATFKMPWQFYKDEGIALLKFYIRKIKSKL